jgi:hypothetical protein
MIFIQSRKAGLRVEKVEVSADGRLSLVTSRGKQEVAPDTNEWDRPHDKTALRP